MTRTDTTTTAMKWPIEDVSSRTRYGTGTIVRTELPERGSRARVNLFLPGITHRWNFGGIETALRFFYEMAKHFDFWRIIVLNEEPSQFEPEYWETWSIDPNVTAHRSILYLGDRKTALTLSADDFFITTHFQSAFFCEHVIARQMCFFSCPRRHHVYFIQEYEAGYFPWSAESANAEWTYKDTRDTVAVFNTAIFADFFAREGYEFSKQYIYEPMLLPTLQQRRATKQAKERIILVYARPGHARNGFDTIIEALRVWASKFPAARDWVLVSDGQAHPDVELGNGVVLNSRGRLSLADYADLLSRCWVGVSIVFSPHPGYTVLEMAEFGSWTITNSWKNKVPSLIAPNVLGVVPPYPESIADQLSWACSQYLDDSTAVLPNLKPVIRSNGDEFPFVPDLLRLWEIFPETAKLGP